MKWSKCLSGLLMFVSIAPAFAQEDTQQLQTEVNELRTTVKAMQAEINTLKAAQAQTTNAPAQVPATTTATASQPSSSTPSATTAIPASPSLASSLQPNASQIADISHSPLPAQQSVSDNANSASRIDNEAPPTDPDLKGFIQIPGTQTMIRLGGYAKLDTIYDTNTIGTPDQFITAAIPVPSPHDDSGNFTMQARQTRFSLDVRRPTIFDENMRFYFENDFYGGSAGEYQFHLRQAFGQLGNTFAGYGWSAFTDVDASPDTLDFAGPNAFAGLRQANIHQIFPLGQTGSLTISAENPTSEVSSYTPDTTLRGTQHAPDLVLAGRTEHDWGHLQLSALLRQLGYTDGEHSDRTLGGGVSLAGTFKAGGSGSYSDLLMFGTTWGKGIARYISDTGGAGLDAIVGPSGKLYALTGGGAYGAYTHYWSENWRSNLVYGYTRLQSSPWLASNAFRDSDYGAANLIWSPVATLTVGVELLHGRLLEQDNRYNDDTRIQGSLQYSFIK